MRISRFLVAVVILVAGIGGRQKVESFAHDMVHQSDETRTKFELFPSSLGRWRVVTKMLTERQIELLKVDDYLFADFVDGTPEGRISVYVGYYVNPGRATQHPPTICYPGSGWTNTYEGDTRLSVPGLADGLEVSATVFEKGDLKELIVYWYSMSGYTGSKTGRHKLLRLKRLLSGRAAGGASKVQTAMHVETTRESAEEVLEEFLAEFLPVLNRFIPQVSGDGS